MFENEAIRLMIDGGRKLCDEAIDKWMSGVYRTDEPMRQRMMVEWKQKKETINELGRHLRNGVAK